MVWIVLSLATFYTFFCATLYFLQEQLIFPGHASQGQPVARVADSPNYEVATLKAKNGERVVALFARALDAKGQLREDAAQRPTILYFYGNGQSLSSTLGRINAFQRRGFNVMVPDYLGYGLSEGKPGEAGCYAAADAAYDHLLTRKDIDPTRIVAVGRSLGGAVAIDLASRRPVIGLITLSTFTTMADMVTQNYPFVPSMLLAHKFASLDKIATVKVPILIGHGTSDDTILPAMADRLEKAAKTPVTRLNVKGANHNDFYEVGGDTVYATIKKFIEALP